MKSGYKILLGLGMALVGATASYAYEVQAGEKEGSLLGVDVTNVYQDETSLNVSITLDLSNVEMKRSRDLLCTPMLVNGLDTVKFAPIDIAGRDRWYYLQRNPENPLALFQGYGKHEAKVYPQESRNVESLSWIEGAVWNVGLSTPYRQWMDNCEVVLATELRGCASCEKAAPEYLAMAQTDFRAPEYIAEFIYVTPVAEEVKARELSGRAYVDFPVNKIVIYPDYRNNHYELGKIIATIDSVKNDNDITVTSITIKGTASPEGPYENNVYLAKNRTIALKDYVTNLYNFAPDFIQTSYDPVDWTGLREWLESNNIEHKAEILDIVNSNIEDYARNSKIKKDFPAQYQWLLTNVYPALRHSDYVIEYTIRQFTTINEILEVMQTAPQKLSLNEFFMAANSQPEGSDLYNEAFEIAVKLYPNNEVANLNAGIAAMKRGDYVSANKYLSKAGKSDEAVYAVAVLNALEGNKELAVVSFEQLAKGNGSVAEASKRALESLKR